MFYFYYNPKLGCVGFFVCCALLGCIALYINYLDNKHTTIVGQNGTRYESYREPCDDNDFQAAHEFIMLMEKEKDGSWTHKWNQHDIEKAKEYVFRKEALFLMSQNDETAKKRIIYLLKEEGSSNDHVSMLIDLAIENEDEAFVKTLANQYESPVSCEKFKKTIGYLLSQGDNKNKAYTINLITKYNVDVDCLMDYLAQVNDIQLSDFVLGRLSKIKIDAEKPTTGRNIDSGTPPTGSSYIRQVKEYNQLCLKILEVGIRCKNHYLAQKAIEKIKPNYIIYNDHWEGKRFVFYVREDSGDIKEGRKTLNEAVKSGAFNN